ncbi:MAG TPA: hypothetical protein VIJ53_01450 [Acidobacteriaceae bacterium]
MPVFSALFVMADSEAATLIEQDKARAEIEQNSAPKMKNVCSISCLHQDVSFPRFIHLQAWPGVVPFSYPSSGTVNEGAMWA